MFEKLIWYLFSQLSTQYAVTLCLFLTLSKSGLCSIDSPPSRILITVAVKKKAAGVFHIKSSLQLEAETLVAAFPCSDSVQCGVIKGGGETILVTQVILGNVAFHFGFHIPLSISPSS